MWSLRLLSTLLNEMDGVEERTKPLVIATPSSNSDLSAFDAALVRPGRFDTWLDVPALSLSQDALPLWRRCCHALQRWITLPSIEGVESESISTAALSDDDHFALSNLTLYLSHCTHGPLFFRLCADLATALPYSDDVFNVALLCSLCIVQFHGCFDMLRIARCLQRVHELEEQQRLLSQLGFSANAAASLWSLCYSVCSSNQ